MGEQGWALLIGVVTVIVLRIIDWYLPKDFVSKWALEHGVKREKKHDDEEDGEEDDGR